MKYTGSPAFSLSKSLKKSISDMSQHNPITPGPIYNISKLAQNNKHLSQSIGKSRRAEINHRIQQTPSPLHYQPKKITSIIQKTFPKSSSIDPVNQNPDPACYIPDAKHTTKKILTYTLTSRQPSIMDQKNSIPGPAHYRSQQNLPILVRSKNTKQNLFGSDSRFKQTINSTPGVGNYSLSTNKLSQFEHKYSLGRAERQMQSQLTPGRIKYFYSASDYHRLSFVQESLKDKLGKTMSGRFRETFKSDKTTKDAFHKYLQNPQNAFVDSKTNPMYSIGKNQRKPLQSNQNPGPTEYINNSFLIKHSSTALMPQSYRSEYSDTAYKPGPGTYEPKPEIGVKYSFPKSKSIAYVRGDGNPGVGRYQVEKLKVSRANSFSKSQRFIKYNSNQTGAGDYQITCKRDMRNVIGKSDRFKQQKNISPGPGDYHITTLIGFREGISK